MVTPGRPCADSSDTEYLGTSDLLGGYDRGCQDDAGIHEMGTFK